MSTTRLVVASGWAVYLGCSWTWCIGLFLPVILLRDFGWLSWVAFAVPNVIGAALMGFVLAEGRVSQQFVARHGTACTAFSILTVLFQLYFLVWATVILDPPAGLLGGVLFLLVVLSGLIRIPGPAERLIAGLVWVASLGAMVCFVATQPVTKAHFTDPAFGAMASRLPFLLPVFMFGFAFSPYLDLTLHHVTQQTRPDVTRMSFLLGFGVCFLAMLVFTLLYAPTTADLFFSDRPSWLSPRNGVASLLYIHFAVQTGFTAILHLHRLRTRATPSWRRDMLGLGVLVTTAAMLWALGQRHRLFALSGHEVIYRAFMAFYGLVAPTYVWICVIPFRTLGLNRKVDWVILGGTIALAGPLFAWAFLAEAYHLLAPGVCLVLFAPLFRYFITKH